MLYIRCSITLNSSITHIVCPQDRKVVLNFIPTVDHLNLSSLPDTFVSCVLMYIIYDNEI